MASPRAGDAPVRSSALVWLVAGHPKAGDRQTLNEKKRKKRKKKIKEEKRKKKKSNKIIKKMIWIRIFQNSIKHNSILGIEILNCYQIA